MNNGIWGLLGAVVGVLGTWGSRLILPAKQVQNETTSTLVNGFAALYDRQQVMIVHLTERVALLEGALRGAGIPVP